MLDQLMTLGPPPGYAQWKREWLCLLFELVARFPDPSDETILICAAAATEELRLWKDCGQDTIH